MTISIKKRRFVARPCKNVVTSLITRSLHHNISVVTCLHLKRSKWIKQPSGPLSTKVSNMTIIRKTVRIPSTRRLKQPNHHLSNVINCTLRNSTCLIVRKVYLNFNNAIRAMRFRCLKTILFLNYRSMNRGKGLKEWPFLMISVRFLQIAYLRLPLTTKWDYTWEIQMMNMRGNRSAASIRSNLWGLFPRT